jgi:hypothetical protein
MFYGVEQSTDKRCPNTVIKKFTSIRSLKKWMEFSGRFTHENPEFAMNWHHTYRMGYYLNGRINKKDKIFSDKGSRTYPRSLNDNIDMYLYVYGVEVS